MNSMGKVKKWLGTVAVALVLSACGEEDGVDGTGLTPSIDVQIFQACMARAPSGDCADTDFNGDGFVNYTDYSLLKAAAQYDLNLDGVIDTTDSEDNPDLTILNDCLGAVTEACQQADFNRDKDINESDIALFQSAAQFDLDSDQMVDLRGIMNIVVEYSEDLAILLDCIYDAPQDACASSDLNEDGVIDFRDADTFVDASRFDLNRDGIIDLRNDANEDIANVEQNEDLQVIKDCFFLDIVDFPQCAVANFNEDTTVNQADLALFKASDKFDLNLDGFVDLRVVIESQDLTLIKDCFFQAAVGACIPADFNTDNIINAADLAEFKSSGRFDLNGDLIIDLRDTETNKDLNIIKDCFFESTGPCLDADFNADGIVNASDLGLFNSAIKYDLNADFFVDLRVTDALASFDLAIIDLCFFSDAIGECASADFNADGSINATDLAEFKSSSRYDLNGDLVVDLHDTTTNADLNIIKECFFSTAEACMIANINGDDAINAEDLAAFKAAEKYDLNNDLIVDLREPPL